jgi:hypothetical protein
VIDRTRRTRFTKHLTMASPDLTSAEWIVEAPSSCGQSGFCHQIALTNFGTVAFTRSYATGNGLGGTISNPNWATTGLKLIPRAHPFFGGNDASDAAGYGGAGALPSALIADGSGFAISWQANPLAALDTRVGA